MSGAKTMREISIEEVKQHASSKDMWTVIDNKVYDVTSFVDEHPGGVLILAGAGSDATVLFHHYHITSFNKASAVMRSKQIGVLVGSTSPVMGPFYEALRTEVAQELKDLPKRPLLAKVLFFADFLGLLTATLAGLYVSLYVPDASPVLLYIIGAAVIALGTRAGGQSHALGHMQLFGAESVEFMEKFAVVCGSKTSNIGYSLPSRDRPDRLLMNEPRAVCQRELADNRGPFEHQGIHHVRGAALEHDECKAAASLLGSLRLSAEDEFKTKHYLQSNPITQRLLLMFFYILADTVFPLKAVMQSRQLFQKGAYGDLARMLCGMCVHLSMVYVSVVLPLQRSLLVFLLLRCTTYVIGFNTMFFAQHRWEINLSEEYSNQDWGRHNCETSLSLWGENMKWHPLVWGGAGACPSTLTYHLEHTLFPGVNYLHLPRVARVCKAVCERMGVQYTMVPDYLTLCKAHGEHLYRYGTPNEKARKVD